MNLDNPPLGETASYHDVDSSLYTAPVPFPCLLPEYSIPTYIAQNHLMHPAVSVAGRDVPFLPDSDPEPTVFPYSLVVNSAPPSLHGPPAPQYLALDGSSSLNSTYDTT